MHVFCYAFFKNPSRRKKIILAEIPKSSETEKNSVDFTEIYSKITRTVIITESEIFYCKVR